MPFHRSLPFAAALLVSGAIVAQTNYGQATAGAGGVRPRAWFAGSPSPGTPALTFELDRAVGGGPTLLLLGVARAQVPVLGITLLVQPLVSLFVGLASGTSGAPGAGTANVPLAVPNDPTLLGILIDSQWVVFDQGAVAGLAASEGFELRIVPPPLVLASGSTGGADPIIALDPTTGSFTNWSSTIGADNPSGVEFTPDGTLCVVSAELSHRYFIADVTNGCTLLASVLVPANALPNAIAITPDSRRAYGIMGGPQGSGAGQIIEIDLDRNSPTFGTQIGIVTGVPIASQLEGVGIAADGRSLCACNLGLGQAPFAVFVDIDPASPTFNTVTLTVPLTNLPTDVRMSRDGALAYVCVAALGPGGWLQIIDASTGLFVASVPNIGTFPTDLEISPRGDFVLIACPNSNEIVKIDVDPASPTYLQRTAALMPVAPFAVAIAPDGRTAWCGEQFGTNVHRIDTATMTLQQTFPVGAVVSDAICVR